ncbi:unnamed protein product [Closterium sp. NIES-65]|nr:unnamed protein product [Closterium sp. NIES-65]
MMDMVCACFLFPSLPLTFPSPFPPLSLPFPFACPSLPLPHSFPSPPPPSPSLPFRSPSNPRPPGVSRPRVVGVEELLLSTPVTCKQCVYVLDIDQPHMSGRCPQNLLRSDVLN